MKSGANKYLQFRLRQWRAQFLVLLIGVIAAAGYIVWVAFNLTEVGFYLTLGSALFGVYKFLRGATIASQGIRRRTRKHLATAHRRGLLRRAMRLVPEVRALVRRHRRGDGAAGSIKIEVIPSDPGTPHDYRALMLDSVFGKDYLYVTAELWELLDGDERDGLVAHEVSHEDQMINHLLHALRSVFSAAMLLGIGLVLWAISFGELPRMAFMVILPGSIAWLALTLATCRLSKIVEFITDFRAVQVTKNLPAYIRMLRKVDAAEAKELPHIAEARKLWITRIFESHPSTDERIASLDGIQGS